jgi:chemotaxis protein CheX
MSTFVVEQIDKMLKIKCPAVIGQVEAADFSSQAKTWLLKAAEKYVFDFSGVSSIAREFYPVMIEFKSLLKRDNKFIYSIHLSGPLLKDIRASGLDTAFNPVASLEAAAGKPQAATNSKKPLSVEFINPFIAAAEKTFTIQCKTKIKIGKPQLKGTSSSQIAIVSVLTLISEGYSGSVILSFTEPVFLKIYENMFEEKHDKIHPEIQDAAGELLNIIYGMVKTELNTKGYKFQKALPTVLVGTSLSVRQSGVFPAVQIPFETDFGVFFLEIEFSHELETKNV